MTVVVALAANALIAVPKSVSAALPHGDQQDDLAADVAARATVETPL